MRLNVYLSINLSYLSIQPCVTGLYHPMFTCLSLRSCRPVSLPSQQCRPVDPRPDTAVRRLVPPQSLTGCASQTI